LNAGILGNRLRNSRSDQQERLVIAPTPHKRDGFPLEASDFAIGQNRLQSVANFDASTVVVDRVKDQHTAISGFASDPPLMEQIDGVAFDVGAIERMNGRYRDLGMGFFVNLPADFFDLRDGVRVQNMCEIVDVASGFQFRNRFGLRRQNRQQHSGET
jgi:hypothetical protein